MPEPDLSYVPIEIFTSQGDIMFFSESDGQFKLADGEIIGPALTKTTFLSGSLGQQATVFVQNREWSSYKLSDMQVFGYWFVVILFFHYERLYKITLYRLDKTEKYPDRSEKGLLEIKKKNDAILKEVLGTPPYTYVWGTVTTSVDMKGGSSIILMSYGTHPNIQTKPQSY